MGVNTYPVEIFAQFSAFYDENSAVAISLPMVVLVIFLILLQRWVMRGLDYVRINPDSDSKNPIVLNKHKYYGIILLIIIFVVTILFPFISVMANIGSFSKILSTLSSFGDCLLTTSLLALGAAVVSTAVAFTIGYRLAHNHNRLTSILDIFCWLPIAIPGSLIGLGLIGLAVKIPNLQKNDSFGFLLLLAYIGMFTGFSIRVFQSAYKRADPNIDEAAAMECHRWYQRLLYIDMPIHSGDIVVSMIMVFVLVLGELNATVLLIPPGKATLSVSIDNLLHYGANAAASALCLIEAGLVILVVISGLFMWSVFKRNLR